MDFFKHIAAETSIIDMILYTIGIFSFCLSFLGWKCMNRENPSAYLDHEERSSESPVIDEYFKRATVIRRKSDRADPALHSMEHINFAEDCGFYFFVLLRLIFWMAYFHFWYKNIIYGEFPENIDLSVVLWIVAILLAGVMAQSVGYQLNQRESIYNAMGTIQSKIINLVLRIYGQSKIHEVSDEFLYEMFDMISALHWLIYYKTCDDFKSLEPLAKANLLHQNIMDYISQEPVTQPAKLLLKIICEKLSEKSIDINWVGKNENVLCALVGAMDTLSGEADYELPWVFDVAMKSQLISIGSAKMKTYFVL